MMNIKVLNTCDIRDFIAGLWSSDVFQTLHNKKGSIIDILISKIEIAPIFFYEISHKKERNSLTSFVRFISYRNYENTYIQDLYYFHELMHLASYKPELGLSFDQWKENLDQNELIASLYSEAFIYLFAPELLDKTFNDLWVKRFVDNNLNTIEPLGLGLNNSTQDSKWLELYQSNQFNFFELNNWTQQIDEIINQRLLLRKKIDRDDLDAAQIQIIKYNNIRNRWLEKWSNYYQNINQSLSAFLADKNIDNYLKFVEISSKDHMLFPNVID